MAADPRVNQALFEQIVMPHLDAGWNLARWLLRDPNEAEDVLQEACLRSYRFIESYRGGEARSWFLAIVRNLCRSNRRDRHAGRDFLPLDDHSDRLQSEGLTPPEQMEQLAANQELRAAIENLPVEFREVLVLREFEGLSYKEIAAVTSIPIGTVMSRLARSREQLAAMLMAQLHDEEAWR